MASARQLRELASSHGYVAVASEGTIAVDPLLFRPDAHEPGCLAFRMHWSGRAHFPLVRGVVSGNEPRRKRSSRERLAPASSTSGGHPRPEREA